QKAIILIKSGKISSILLGDKVFRRLISFISQTSSHNLFHLSIMYINAWSKFHHFHILSCIDNTMHIQSAQVILYCHLELESSAVPLVFSWPFPDSPLFVSSPSKVS